MTEAVQMATDVAQDTRTPSRSPLTRRRPSRSTSCQAPAPSGGPGHRRLQHDRRRRQGDGVPVGWQGQLHAAGHPDEPAKRAPIKFELVAVNLDQSSLASPDHVLPEYLARWGALPHRDPGHLRHRQASDPRGQDDVLAVLAAAPWHLYRVAQELGCTKIALGHHRDDIMATVMMNMFFNSRLKGMPPKLVSDDGKNVVIRPLAYVTEEDTIAWAQHREFPIIPCTLCGSQENLQRKQVGAMLKDWDRKFPGRVDNMFTALANVVPSHLMDRELFPFETIKPSGQATADGDIAFDEEENCGPSEAPRARTIKIVRTGIERSALAAQARQGSMTARQARASFERPCHVLATVHGRHGVAPRSGRATQRAFSSRQAIFAGKDLHRGARMTSNDRVRAATGQGPRRQS